MLFSEEKKEKYTAQIIKERKIYNGDALLLILDDNSEVLLTSLVDAEKHSYAYPMDKDAGIYIVLGDYLFTVKGSPMICREIDGNIFAVLLDDNHDYIFIKCDMTKQTVESVYETKESRIIKIYTDNYADNNGLSTLVLDAIRAVLVSSRTKKPFNECIVEQAWDDLDFMRLLMKMKESDKISYLKIAEDSATNHISKMIEDEYDAPEIFKAYFKFIIDDVEVQNPATLEGLRERIGSKLGMIKACFPTGLL